MVTRGANRTGPRTTLRLPESVEQAASVLAEEQHVSRNDALVLLASRGADAFALDRELRERSGRQREALRDASRSADTRSAEFPSIAEAETASRAWREHS